MWRTEKDVKSKGAREHLEKLERELRKVEDRDSVLAVHLRRLKIGWGRACAVPKRVA